MPMASLLASQRRTYASCFFFFNDTAPTEIYTLSLHDALPISAAALQVVPARRRDPRGVDGGARAVVRGQPRGSRARHSRTDRKSTRLNSSHGYISYAVFCLKKKKVRMHPRTAQHALPDCCKFS